MLEFTEKMKEFNSKLSRETIGEIQIFLAVLLYGFIFVFQKYAMENGCGPFTFNAFRYMLSTIIVYATKPWVLTIVNSAKDDNEVDVEVANMSESERSAHTTRELWFWGLVCGVTLCGGAEFQQLGLVTVEASKAGFMCGSYVILIPIILWMVPAVSRKPCIWTWICAILSMAGLYMLSGCSEGEVCVGDTFSIGELYIVCATIFWAVNIILVNAGANKVDAVELTGAYFLVAAVLCLILALIFETSSFAMPFTALRRNLVLIIGISILNSSAAVLATLGCIVMFGAVLLFSFMAGKEEQQEVIENESDRECNNETSPLMSNDTNRTRIGSRSRDTVDSTMSRASRTSRVSTTLFVHY